MFLSSLEDELPDDTCNFPYTLPDVDRDLTHLEKEFRNMFTEFACYTERDIMSVESPRLRALYEGVGASARDPAVYRAFEVLFEDMMPLRIAGRMIYNKLKQVMADAQIKREVQVESVAASTGLEAHEVEVNRVAFLRLAAASEQDSGEPELSIQQLIDTGIADTVVELLGFDNFDEFLQALDKNNSSNNNNHKNNKKRNNSKKESVSFAELMIALQRCSRESGDRACQPATVLPELAKRMAASKSASNITTLPLDERKQKYSADYDAMLKAFGEWENAVPTGQGRMLDVLRGCFAGARNQKVLEALRIVYVDYSALRVAGNLIFKLMSALMARHRKATT
jgi:hypothetical protein